MNDASLDLMAHDCVRGIAKSTTLSANNGQPAALGPNWFAVNDPDRRAVPHYSMVRVLA